MALISIPQNAGPTAGEQYVTFQAQAYQYPDGSIASGSVLVDGGQNMLNVDLLNVFLENMMGEDEVEFFPADGELTTAVFV